MSHWFSLKRYFALAGAAVLALVSLIGLFWSLWFLIPLALFGALGLLGLYDVVQVRGCPLLHRRVLHVALLAAVF